MRRIGGMGWGWSIFLVPSGGRCRGAFLFFFFFLFLTMTLLFLFPVFFFTAVRCIGVTLFFRRHRRMRGRGTIHDGTPMRYRKPE